MDQKAQRKLALIAALLDETAALLPAAATAQQVAQLNADAEALEDHLDQVRLAEDQHELRRERKRLADRLVDFGVALEAARGRIAGPAAAASAAAASK